VVSALPRTLVALPSLIGSLPSRIASRPIRISLTPQTKRRLVLAAVVAFLLGALYHLWLRDSALVAVNEVEVIGLTSKDAPRIQAMLESVAEDMTTLHVRTDELEEAASQFPVVGSIAVEADFPHGLRIEVEERAPVGLVPVDGVPLPVAGDGTVLRGLTPPKGLPLLRMETPAPDGHVTDPQTLRALLVMGAAPTGFPQRIERVGEGPERGIVLELRDGPEVIFGDADYVAEKWIAAARVLADPDAAGASYIDVRLPERPVAGGLPVETIEPVAPAGEVIAPPVTELPTDPTAPADPAATTTDPTTTTDPSATTTTPTPPTAAPTTPTEAAPAAPTTETQP
jgi:cell division protein FtsQ